MNEHLQSAMSEATRLTAAGRLSEATALIQRTLGAASGFASSPAGHSGAEERPRLHLPDAGLPVPGGELGVATLPPRPRLPVPPDPGAGSGQTGGRFIDASHTDTAGTRAYKLYIPSGYTGQAVPLIVMLHGGTQTAADFAAGTQMNALAERETFLVAYPEQPISANSTKCWNWFQAGDQQRGVGEPSLIAGITQQIMRTHRVDAGRVYVAGLSAGGAMAAVMAATYPDLYAAVGVHSGLAYSAAHDLPSAFAAMKRGASSTRRPATVIPLIVFHGDRDQTVDRANADHLLEHWCQALGDGQGGLAGSAPAAVVEGGQAAGGRRYTRFCYSDAGGRVVMEQWIVHDAGHAWSGGSARGSYADPQGPDASAEMVRFFREHRGAPADRGR